MVSWKPKDFSPILQRLLWLCSCLQGEDFVGSRWHAQPESMFSFYLNRILDTQDPGILCLNSTSWLPVCASSLGGSSWWIERASLLGWCGQGPMCLCAWEAPCGPGWIQVWEMKGSGHQGPVPPKSTTFWCGIWNLRILTSIWHFRMLW